MRTPPPLGDKELRLAKLARQFDKFEAEEQHLTLQTEGLFLRGFLNLGAFAAL